MNTHSVTAVSAALPPIWRQRLLLLFIASCFIVPMVLAWLLVDHWRPGHSVQHGELLNPARPFPALSFEPINQQSLGVTGLQGHWVLAYVGSGSGCDTRCQTGLYHMRQVRLALGKEMGRLQTVLLLDAAPDAGLSRWLLSEHPAMTMGVSDFDTRNALFQAFPKHGRVGEWLYLLDPHSNLLMRYPVDTEPRGLLKDLKRLLKWSKIG